MIEVAMKDGVAVLAIYDDDGQVVRIVEPDEDGGYDLTEWCDVCNGTGTGPALPGAEALPPCEECGGAGSGFTVYESSSGLHRFRYEGGDDG